MNINSAYWLVLIGLITACSSNDEPEKVVYVEQETVTLDRSSQDRAKTLTELGLAYYQLEKYNYAEENLQRSLKLDNKNATTYQIFALLKQRSKQPEQAQHYFDKALKLEPDDFDILTAYAVFLYEEERHDEAVIEFKRIVNSPFYKKKWVAYSYLGLYDLENDELRAAEIKFYKALQADPTYSLALSRRLKFAIQKGK